MAKVVKNRNILFNEESICRVSSENLRIFEEQASVNDSRRFRYCLHEDTNAPVQEMINFWPPYTYFQPHSHPYYAETKLLIKGEMLVLLFDEGGNVENHFIMSAEKGCDILRLKSGIIHTNITLTDTIMMEYTPGPFDKEKNNIYLESYPEEMRTEDILELVNLYSK